MAVRAIREKMQYEEEQRQRRFKESTLERDKRLSAHRQSDHRLSAQRQSDNGQSDLRIFGNHPNFSNPNFEGGSIETANRMSQEMINSPNSYLDLNC